MQNRCLRSENRFVYMLSTCTSDLCTGFSCFYIGSIGNTLDMRSSHYSTYHIVPTFLGLSYLITLAAQADRYHAVTSPYRYTHRMSLGKTILLIVAMWVYAFIIVAVNNLVTSQVATKVTGTGTFFCYLFTMVIMIGLNIKLFMIAKYQLERDPPTPEREAKRSSLYLIIVVSGCFLVTWLPTLLSIILCDFLALNCNAMAKEVTALLKILPRMNAAITPVLYVYGCTPLRRSFIRVWRPVCRCGRSGPVHPEMKGRLPPSPSNVMITSSPGVQIADHVQAKHHE
ncbi:hypothetical protein FKM82_029072 [Ascaphus truei]